MAKQAERFTTKSGILLGPARIEFPFIYEGNPDPKYGKGKFMASFRMKQDDAGKKTIAKLEAACKELWKANFPGVPYAPGRLPWSDGNVEAKSKIVKAKKLGASDEDAERKASFVRGTFEIKSTRHPNKRNLSVRPFSLYGYKALGEDGTTKAPLPENVIIEMGDIVRWWVILAVYRNDDGDACFTTYLDGIQLISKGSARGGPQEDEECTGDFAEDEGANF